MTACIFNTCSLRRIIYDVDVIDVLRIINVSSGLGHIAYVKSNIKEQVLKSDLTVDKLTAIMDTFVR